MREITRILLSMHQTRGPFAALAETAKWETMLFFSLFFVHSLDLLLLMIFIDYASIGLYLCLWRDESVRNSLYVEKQNLKLNKVKVSGPGRRR